MGNSCSSSSSAYDPVARKRNKSTKKTKAPTYDQPLFKKMAIASSFHGALMAVGTSTHDLIFMSRRKSNAAARRRHVQQQSFTDVGDEKNAKDQQQTKSTSPMPHAPIYRSLSSMFFKVEILSHEEAEAQHNDNKYDSDRRYSDASTTVESTPTSVSCETTEEDEEIYSDVEQAANKGQQQDQKMMTRIQHKRNLSGSSNVSVDWRDAEGGDAMWREKLCNLRAKYDWDDLPLDELVDAQVGEAKNISILRRIGYNTLPGRKYVPPVSSRAAAGVACRGFPTPSGICTAPQVV